MQRAAMSVSRELIHDMLDEWADGLARETPNAETKQLLHTLLERIELDTTLAMRLYFRIASVVYLM